MKNKNGSFEELAKAKIQERRNVVISAFRKDKDEEAGFTIAQQVEVEEGNKTFNMFLKESIHVDNLEGLVAVRDALNFAISSYKEKVEKEKADEELWD